MAINEKTLYQQIPRKLLDGDTDITTDWFKIGQGSSGSDVNVKFAAWGGFTRITIQMMTRRDFDTDTDAHHDLVILTAKDTGTIDVSDYCFIRAVVEGGPAFLDVG